MLEYEVHQNSNLNWISYLCKLLTVNKTELSNVSTNLLLKKQHCKSKWMTWYSFCIDIEWSTWLLIFIWYLCIEWSMWFLIFIWYSCTEWSTWLLSCQNAAVQFDIVCSLISFTVWYCLHSFILFFLFNFNCASTSLYIFRLEHALLILYFLHYIVIESNDIFQKRDICYEYMTSS